ncbi:MAG: glycosyltransferase [Bacteroidota bacterium]
MSRPRAKKAPHLMLVNVSKSWGGGEQWMFAVAQAWQTKGHEVELLVYPGSALQQRLVQAGIPHTAMPLRTWRLLNPILAIRLYRHLKKRQPDVLLLNASHELKTAGWMGHLAGIQEIIFRRGVSYALSVNAWNRYLLNQVATRFLANSKATFEAMTTAFPALLAKPTLTLNNGVKPEGWEPDAVGRIPHRIGVSARLSPEKGLERLLRAIQWLKRQGNKGELLLLGEGPQRVELQQLARDLGIEERVIFAGFVSDVPRHLRSCAAFGFTPHFGEGTSIALIEAMLLELPCVVMDTPAMSEVVVSGETGYVIPDGDIPALAAAFHRLLSDAQHRDELGQKARERALKYFTLDRIIEALEDWLQATSPTGE